MGSPMNYVSVSRRPPDVEDYIEMLRRYRSWIIGPMFAGIVVSVVVAFLWPDTYRSMAVMRITPQQVSERLVPSEVSQQMGERLQQMEQDILSRGSLSELIMRPSLDLYKKERQDRPVEDIIQDMRNKYIRISILETPGTTTPTDKKFASAFQISFDYTDRYKAQQVVRELVTKFTESSVVVQRNHMLQTTQFLDDELKNAQQHVNETSAKLTKFRQENQGRLPEQANANGQMAASLQQQAATVSEALSRAVNSKMILETQLRGLQEDLAFYSTHTDEALLPGGGMSSPASVKNAHLLEIEKDLSSAENEQSQLAKTWKPTLPQMIQLKARIENLRAQKEAAEKDDAAQLAQVQAQAVSTTQPVRVVNPAVQAHLQQIKDSIELVKTNIATTAAEITARTNQQTDLNRRISDYQVRIEASPLNEQAYAQLVGDFNLAKQQYDDTMKRHEMADTTANLDEHKAGENLEVLDPASLPEDSIEPKRPMWVAVGTAVGLMVGIMLAGAKEMKNTSLKNLKDVRAYTNLPVLSSIPLLENALLVRRKRRLFWLAWSSAFIIGSIAMSGAMYYHFFGKS
jgi:succinoglycan biosynthesis transport protein ExoP